MSLNIKISHAIVCCCIILFASACNGMFDGVYDNPQDTPKDVESQLYIDATSWTDWYYISFDSLEQYREAGNTDALRYHQTHFTAYPIPVSPTGEMTTTHPDENNSGVYTYWYDVFGKGLSVNEFRSYTPADKQPEPEHWDIAVHYKDARTNGASVLETPYTSFDDLPASSSEFSGAPFTADEWTENVVWVDRSEMLNKLIGCQGIKINRVLSSWLDVEMQTPPPTFSQNNHIFVIRLANGKYVAVQLANYMNANGDKCWLTINYKYPY